MKRSTRRPGRVLLDTNIVIAFLSGEQAVVRGIRESEVAVPSVVLGELYYGARKSARASANLNRIVHFASPVDVASCDAATAQYYGLIKDRLRVRGHPIPENDIWIAALALQIGAPLVTRGDHFRHIDDLVVEHW